MCGVSACENMQKRVSHGETVRVGSSEPVVLKVGGAPPWGGANTLQGGRDVTDGEKKKTTADLSLVSESSLSGEMQGAGLTQTNQIRFCS